MKEIETIKQMITKASHDDAEEMFKIDCAVWWAYNPQEHVYFSSLEEYTRGALETFNGGSTYNTPPRYSKSIDSQKALGVEGWKPKSLYKIGDMFVFGLRKLIPIPCSEIDGWVTELSLPLPTEALARLYCWLCVKQWEENNDLENV